MTKVLVTGGSGFVASHALSRLLGAGYDVRTTLRSPAREAPLRATLQAAGVETSRLEVAIADLLRDDGWAEATRGVAHVLHVASPFPAVLPRDERELLGPAREGALRVLRASRDAGVRRVVLTSSFAAIGYGHPVRATPFDERDWTNVEGPDASAYVRSKTLAERAAWDFVEREGGGLELSTVNPVGIFGPLLGGEPSTSLLVVQRLLSGQLPGCPRFHFGVVDVRDVVELHVLAMLAPQAAGERFLAVAGPFLSMLEIGRVLRRRLGSRARRVPRLELPDFLVRWAALRDPAVRQILPELGRPKDATSDKARRMLGWSPRSVEDALVATAESLLQSGAVGRG